MSDLVDRVVEALKATELDYVSWHPDCQRELALAAIEAVRANNTPRRLDPTPDKINEAFKRATRC